MAGRASECRQESDLESESCLTAAALQGCASAGSGLSQLKVKIAQNGQSREKGRMYWF